MGYALHIHRGQTWADLPAADQIAFDEWEQYVSEAEDMRLADAAESTSPSGEVIRVEGDGTAEWVGPAGEPGAWFTFFEGRITVTGPDDAAINRMHEIARALSARVQGDEGEFYDAQPTRKSPGRLGRLFGRR